MKGMLLLLLVHASFSIRFLSLHGFNPVLNLGEKGAYAKRRVATRSKASRARENRARQAGTERRSRRAVSKKSRSHYNSLISNFSSVSKQIFYAKI